MLNFCLQNADGTNTLTLKSEGFTHGVAKSPLLYKAMVESFGDAHVEVTAHRAALLKSFCNIVATGAQFTDASVTASDGNETVKFTVSY